VTGGGAIAQAHSDPAGIAAFLALFMKAAFLADGSAELAARAPGITTVVRQTDEPT
jgi:hypothetical protein